MSLDRDDIVATRMYAAWPAKDFTRMCDAISNSADQKLKRNITDGYTYEKEKKEMAIHWKVEHVNIEDDRCWFNNKSAVRSRHITGEVRAYFDESDSRFAALSLGELHAQLQNIIEKGQRDSGSNDAFNEYCRKDIEITRKAYSSMGMIIKNVIFANPATIVFWMDGTKTVVKCQEGDIYDPEKGLAMAIAKKALGNKGKYCNVFKKWLPEGHEEEFKKAIKESMRKDRKTGPKKAK